MNKKLIYSFGIAAPIVYFLAVVLGGMLWPGYSHIRQAISELTMATAPNQIIIQPLFALYNILVLLFGIGVFAWAKSKLLKTSAILLIMISASGLLMYFFPQDPINIALTFRGLMHFILAGIEALGSILVIFIAGFGLAKVKGLEWFKAFSIIMGSIVFLSGGLTPLAMSKLSAYFGVFERITIFSFIGWLFVFALLLVSSEK